MQTKTWEIDGLQQDRRVRADDVFERVDLQGVVVDHEGWDSFTGFGGPEKYNTWTKVVYFENEDDVNEPSVRGVFEVVFRAGSCVPVEVRLDGKKLVMP